MIVVFEGLFGFVFLMELRLAPNSGTQAILLSLQSGWDYRYMPVQPASNLILKSVKFWKTDTQRQMDLLLSAPEKKVSPK